MQFHQAGNGASHGSLFEKLVLSQNGRKSCCNQLVAAGMMLCCAGQQAHAHDAHGMNRWYYQRPTFVPPQSVKVLHICTLMLVSSFGWVSEDDW